LRPSADAFQALASVPGGLCGASLENVAHATAWLAASKMTLSVRSTKAWRSTSNGPETAVGRGRKKHSCADSAKMRSTYVLACPLLVRRRKPNRVRAASSVAVWVRLPAMMRAVAAALRR
jgi:hypothetical protein